MNLEKMELVREYFAMNDAIEASLEHSARGIFDKETGCWTTVCNCGWTGEARPFALKEFGVWNQVMVWVECDFVHHMDELEGKG